MRAILVLFTLSLCLNTIKCEPSVHQISRRGTDTLGNSDLDTAASGKLIDLGGLFNTRQYPNNYYGYRPGYNNGYRPGYGYGYNNNYSPNSWGGGYGGGGYGGSGYGGGGYGGYGGYPSYYGSNVLGLGSFPNTGYGGYGGYGGNGGLQSYYGYDSNYFGKRNRGFGYYPRSNYLGFVDSYDNNYDSTSYRRGYS